MSTSKKNATLASLTATYTDSENEDDERLENSGVVEVKNPESESPPLPIKVLPQTTTQAQLVDYKDNHAVSEAESMDLENSDSDSENLSSLSELPPEPSGECSKALQEEISKYYDRMQTDKRFDLNNSIKRRKEFRNPSIYEKLIEFCELKEYGTNYPPSVYDPHRWGKESYYEQLSKTQKLVWDKLEKERREKDKAKVEIVSGTAKKLIPGSAPIPASSSTATTSRQKRTKWDQAGTSHSEGGASFTNIQSVVAAAATGTKSTVIPAFGVLAKKPAKPTK